MNRETIARVAHEINRAYCASMGDDSIPDWGNASTSHKKSLLAGVDLHLANPDATPEQSHESWLAIKLAEGWVYGEVKDVAQKQHPCMLPYAELPPEQKAKDFLFRAAVHSLKHIADGSDRIQELERQLAATKNPIPAPVGIGFSVSTGQGVQYIGKRDSFTDTQYGTNLSWTRQQVRYLPADIAAKFLRHRDLFRAYDPSLETQEQTPIPEPVQDDTQAILEKAEADKKKALDRENQLHDVVAQVNEMTKASLAEFASRNYKHEFKARETLGEMRNQVVNLIHQFGVP